MKVKGARSVHEETVYTINKDALVDILKRLGFTIPDDANVACSHDLITNPIVLTISRTLTDDTSPGPTAMRERA